MEGNNYEVFRHFLSDTQEQSVDGEGILIQECCGGTKVQGARIVGNTGNSYIGLWKTPRIEDVTIAENKIFSNTEDFPLIYVNANTNRQVHQMNDVRIENNVISSGILSIAGGGGTGNVIKNNRSTSGGSLEISCHVELENNLGFQVQPCLP